MEREKLLNDLLVMLFNEVLDMENRALITGSFKEISINDMLPGAKESKPLFLQMQIHTSESFLAKFPCLPEPLHNFDV